MAKDEKNMKKTGDTEEHDESKKFGGGQGSNLGGPSGTGSTTGGTGTQGGVRSGTESFGGVKGSQGTGQEKYGGVSGSESKPGQPEYGGVSGKPGGQQYGGISGQPSGSQQRPGSTTAGSSGQSDINAESQSRRPEERRNRKDEGENL